MAITALKTVFIADTGWFRRFGGASLTSQRISKEFSMAVNRDHLRFSWRNAEAWTWIF
jgi:hypothetical protein